MGGRGAGGGPHRPHPRHLLAARGHEGGQAAGGAGAGGVPAPAADADVDAPGAAGGWHGQGHGGEADRDRQAPPQEPDPRPQERPGAGARAAAAIPRAAQEERHARDLFSGVHQRRQVEPAQPDVWGGGAGGGQAVCHAGPHHAAGGAAAGQRGALQRHRGVHSEAAHAARCGVPRHPGGDRERDPDRARGGREPPQGGRAERRGG
mmetsp:Transcript_32034/g.102014  ORF Transcript_32034/g.102014 Transcript_32034/m.102014 type:complete len:206 (-) Transcript_32034:408-1025(-)